jgi:AcrR family transcriptional regulator
VIDRESKRKQITARRQEQILKAAIRVFAQKGFKGATIPEIAGLAGVAVGTIYLYYPGKRELFIAIIDNLMLTPLSSFFNKAEDQGFPATLKEALEDRIQLLQSDFLTILVSLMGEIQRDTELSALFQKKLLGPFLSRMEEMYRSLIDQGEFRRMDPAIAVRLVGSMMIGMHLLKSLEKESSPLNRLAPEEIAGEILNFILHGLTNNASELSKPSGSM